MLSKYLPPALLVLIAVIQIGLTQAFDLTAWKGGGFGMFATLDHGAYRGVDIVVEGPNRSESLAVPPSLETIAARVAAAPTDWLLRELALSVVAREQRYERAVSRVSITVWRTDFSRATLHATEQPLRTFTYVVR